MRKAAEVGQRVLSLLVFSLLGFELGWMRRKPCWGGMLCNEKKFQQIVQAFRGTRAVLFDKKNKIRMNINYENPDIKHS